MTLGDVNIVEFAHAFGAAGFEVTSSEDLADIMQKALSTPGPVLVNIPIDYKDNAILLQ